MKIYCLRLKSLLDTICSLANLTDSHDDEVMKTQMRTCELDTQFIYFQAGKHFSPPKTLKTIE